MAPVHEDAVIMAKGVLTGKTRIRDAAGFTGTVEHVGPVASAKDSTVIYAGIVWDDWSRGMHDGSVLCRKSKQMVRHFQAPHPTAGSFIRLSSLDMGTVWTPSMTVRERYVSMDSKEREAPNNVFPDHMACTSSGKDDKAIEFIGELKIRSQQQVQNLTEISMRRSGICSIDTNLDWTPLRHVQELDMAGNLIADWKTIVDILICLPKLRKLSVAGNRIGDMQMLDDFSCHNLTHFNLNNTGIRKIETLIRIGKSIPSLQELILANNSNLCNAGDVVVANDIDILQSTDNLGHELGLAFPNLIYLDCSKCCCLKCRKNQTLNDSTLENSSSGQSRCCLFHEIQIVAALGVLPTLQTLSLDGNQITHLPLVNGDDNYRHLRHLQISDNCIQNWSDLDTLNSFPSLTGLRVRNNPFLVQKSGQVYSEAVSRCMIIANLPRVQHLNGSAVTEMERKEAARWCIRDTLRKGQHFPKVSQPSRAELGSNDSAHPQYNYWMSLYPNLVARQRTSTDAYGEKDSVLADTILSVTIRSMAADSCTIEPLIRRLPCQLTVSRLKALCARHFGLDPDLQEFKFIVGADAIPNTMDQGDDSSLDYYGIPSDGAEILMFEKTCSSHSAETNF